MHDSLPTSMGSQIIDMLDRWGPERCECVPVEQAAAYCRRLTLGHYENFSVLSRFVPDRMRDGVSAVYAFCRWADDLSDESEDAATASVRLAWWRSELRLCEAGEPRHPVFVALAPMIDRYGLDTALFHRLIDAFEQDQRQNRYDSWDDLIGYCRGSADPVGRLVLQLAGVGDRPDLVTASDAVCTGLQLANHWQDVRRDLVERDRIYIPRACMPSGDFEARLSATASVGHAPDRSFLAEYRAVMRDLVARTRPLLDEVDVLLDAGPADLRSMLWLFAAGGLTILDLIERADHETVLYRVSLSKPRKLWLLWNAARRGRAA
ncbi:MAG: squalene synthase HpnC [Phycisphaerales bacterium]|jgi:squalene synthase HpnC|nr:squalene synthase HpnC [Phycisphaerales bacterium]